MTEPKNENVDIAHEISKVNVKIPPFWQMNPALWFSQVESQFITSRISGDATKFHTVVAAIESSVLAQVSDIIINPPTNDMYTTLKKRLIQRYAESEQLRLKKLLQEVSLGDRKPSDMLRDMRELAGTNVTDELLRSLWSQRLPEQMQMI